MKHITTGFAALACAALLFGCGGGGASAPDPGGNEGNNRQNLPLLAPSKGNVAGAEGSNSVSTVPGQFNLMTGASEQGLMDLIEPMGFNVLSFAHGRATVESPAGMSDAEASKLLDKQYSIGDVQPISRLHTTRPRTVAPWIPYVPSQLQSRNTSFTPHDPWFSDRFLAFAGLNGTTNKPQFLTWFGQGMPLQFMGFNGAWDIAQNATIESQPVKIAIIDAGWFDYSTVNRPDLDEVNQLDAANSGSVDGTGTFTPGLAAAAFETFDDDSDPGTPEIPIRDTGEVMLGILAAPIDSYTPIGNDWDASTVIEEDEVWNEGIAGINPSSGTSYVLIKTGSSSGNTWTFTDAEIAESIDHAVSAGANIILLGMFANGTPSAQLNTAVAAAGTADILVVAPAGDVAASATFDQDTGAVTGFGDTAVDISANPVTPGSAPGVVSVVMTGYNRFPGLADFDPGPPAVPNIGIGYTPILNAPLDANYATVMPFSNTGGTIAAVGYGIGFSYHPLLTQNSGADLFPGENMFKVITLTGGTFATPVYNFSTSNAAAYVAGAASQVFQILSQVNGSTPTDEEVLTELLSSAEKFVRFGQTGIVGVDDPTIGGPDDGGLLNAGAAATSAINGGNLNQTLPPLQFTQLLLSQALLAVTRGTDVTLTPTIANGTAPFELTVDWGDGSAPVVISNWVNSDPVTLAGGYDSLGPKSFNVSLTDANNLTLSAGASLFVINPLSCNISIRDSNGTAVLPNQVVLGTPYTLDANATNVFTGEINGTPNNTLFNWNLDVDAAYEDEGPSITFIPDTPGALTITLDVVEDVRPGGSFTLPITVVAS